MTTDTPKFVLSLDQGTTSTRAMIFDHAGAVVTVGQLEHCQHFPQAGWVEHDPVEIWDNTREVIGQALGKANLTLMHCEETAVAIYGPMPEGGHPSGEIRMPADG